MRLEDVLKTIVVDAVREALRREVETRVEAAFAASGSRGESVEASSEVHDEELARIRRVNALVYLDAGEAAELLRISRKEVYRLVRAEILPVTRIGRKQVFSRADLDTFMASHAAYSPVPMTPEASRGIRSANERS